MRTLNEQIQRVKDALVTCYNAIKRKGGTIPEAGERTLLNMPAAVLSIPQTHGVMTELNVISNGEYLPSDYDADGFSKVTAEFDTSSLPKVKVSAFKVTNACINEDGVWEGEQFIDTSECNSMDSSFEGTPLKRLNASNWNTSKVSVTRTMFNICKSLEYIDATGWDISNITTNRLTGMSRTFSQCVALKEIKGIENWIISSEKTINYEGLFSYCRHLEKLDLSKWNIRPLTTSDMFIEIPLETVDVSNFIMDDCISIYAMFSNSKIKAVDLTKWNLPNCTNTRGAFYECKLLESIIGNRTIKEVLNNDISCMSGLKISSDMFSKTTLLDRASLRALINGLADLTGQTAQTLTLGATLMAKLTEEDIAIATNKNWTLS